MKMRLNMKNGATVAALAVLSALPALAQFDLSWNTIDGGGATFSTNGPFELGGTIGQADAGPLTGSMSGGAFTLVGGFWPGAAAAGCTCPGDINGDLRKNGRDIGPFVQCVLAGGACGCADVDGVPGVDFGDVAVFVNLLLAGPACP